MYSKGGSKMIKMKQIALTMNFQEVKKSENSVTYVWNLKNQPQIKHIVVVPIGENDEI